ncbi:MULTISPECIES: carbohydrate-binding protein [Streptomyces]|uniref:Serine protease n=2 Tax=Streptomyces TaxID=1883 RepID=A0A2U9P3S2_STRAS|nr:carbohydrate-binding protein [Streptomyces actuosus]AWT44419.1 serine protease [Streptomyces actuosus]MBM4820400.1 alpha-lytic protease prodomain-containing protein [Streptomyces actuosus]
MAPTPTTRRRAALVAAGALVLAAAHAAAAAKPRPAAGPAPTAAQTLGADRPAPDVLRAMQRDLKLTAAEAAQRLVNEAEAGTRAGLLRNALGERFAGAWVSGKTAADLTVATTSADDTAAIRAQGAKANVVGSSLSVLKAVKAKLDAAAIRNRNRAVALDTPVWYVDVRGNRVVLQGTSKVAADRFLKAAGVDKDQRVSVQVSDERPRALADIVGGDAYYIDGSARCSIGFSVTKDDKQGFASAGHCGKPGSKTAGSNMADQGTFQASVFPGKDMSWVAVNSDWTATPQVKGEGGNLVQVSGSVRALVGASVCRSGSTTGWHCGTIQEENVSVRYAEGQVDGLTKTDVCAEPGDSGGPYVSGAQGQGTTSGGSGDCTSGGTTFFQPLTATLNDLGLTLKTATADSTVPAPETHALDAWVKGRVYDAGATVTYGEVRYRCLQDHQAQSAWAPELTPALWQRL